MCRGKKSLQRAAVGALWNISALHPKRVFLTDGCEGLWSCALAGVEHARDAIRNVCARCPQHADEVVNNGIAVLSRLSGSRAKHDAATVGVRRAFICDFLK
jgi:hypothetical protein